MYDMIAVPTLLLDEEKCRKNIKMMAEKARKYGIILRPHFKTHQSHEIGRWFREEGSEKITVSSLRMAQYFSEDGWNDILVAFPANILEIETINHLAKDIRLSLLVESVDVAEFLAKNLKSSVNVYIKIDTGLHRTGVDWEDLITIAEILKSVDNSDKFCFTGFLTHAGHSYLCRSKAELEAVHSDSVSKLLKLKSHFSAKYPDLIISVGDTPCCSKADDFSMADEIRPGNYVFYDLTQTIIGSCTSAQVAVAMACPVVAIHRERNEIVIYGGSVHFSSDSVKDREGNVIYGMVVSNEGEGWGDIIRGACLIKLSQEHGIIRLPEDIINLYKPGDIIKIIPAHACTTANLMKEYMTTDGRIISRI